MITEAWLLWGAIVLLVLLPPRWDPAVRLKEWGMEKRDE